MKGNRCIWTWIECLDCDGKGIPIKWKLKSDCGQEIIMTRNNKYGKLLKAATQPNAKEKCPLCGEEIGFYNPYED